MVQIASYGRGDYQRYEYLHRDAANALMRMISAARDEGVWIVPVSGFRDIERQTLLWQDQIQRQGSEELAARLSAPPGYSEHHTGYSIDLADGSRPTQDDITLRFINTKAFEWLNSHGREFGFELSFPENNRQGVMYEPWHWRFVGTPEAEAVFRAARPRFR
ncbi:M15 family metallopeptidase [Synechococcus sp. PCC 6716]|nr:M15 family metallopeptidase [Synechococcus sp. PCC 6716]